MQTVAGTVEASHDVAVVNIVSVVLLCHSTGIDIRHDGVIVAVKSGCVVHESQHSGLAGSLCFQGGSTTHVVG